ncbi:hypothetical protein RND71_034566 [Anisodus tanguticus]|uniref:Myb-like domain-containing protein n=1 Tax=Anisodus tanguticus TaxID=243964 RepID=A0AAE1RCV6_9SOLA|nr:hypothetical protein RND71_034566 [Anisodus tanguticus]
MAPSPEHVYTMSEAITTWTREEDKEFENAIAEFFKSGEEQEWEKIALRVPTKTIQQVKQHYQLLVEAIEAGLVPLPNYKEQQGTDLETGSVDSSSLFNKELISHMVT